MQRRDFHFDLPDELIARYPAQQRDGSRLLVLEGDGAVHHRHFPDLLSYLRKGDLLVFNNTRVIPARLFGAKESGGLRYLSSEWWMSAMRWRTCGPASRPKRAAVCFSPVMPKPRSATPV